MGALSEMVAQVRNQNQSQSQNGRPRPTVRRLSAKIAGQRRQRRQRSQLVFELADLRAENVELRRRLAAVRDSRQSDRDCIVELRAHIGRCHELFEERRIEAPREEESGVRSQDSE